LLSRVRTMRTSGWIFAALVAISLAGCAAPALMVPMVSSTSLTAPVPPDIARIVFIQRGFDGWYNDHASIVDETGRLLGESSPDTWFSVDLPPGEHEFFGWQSDWPGVIPFVRGCICFGNHCTEIAAMRAKLKAGPTYYVTLRGVGDAGETWVGGHPFDFVRTAPDVEEWPRSVTSRLRPMATLPGEATALTAASGADYLRSIVCMGEKRMADASGWVADVSDLLEDDGR